MLLVYGPRSTDYDFGPDHPLTPRRFGPGIDLLGAVGALPGLAPEPAPDEHLRWCHAPDYIRVVRAFSERPDGPPARGIATGGDDPPFAGMHEAAAAVAGGSIAAMEAILRGDVEHAHHPGGGLHHAMADRAAGFCIYDDPALAIARARAAGLRVMYVDLDVHHGDGVQALHWTDPGVLTVSIHESGRTLFPGTGSIDEVGEGTAAGTSVNLPLPAGTGEGAWLDALTGLLPELAATFGPDVVVSQHGADSHAWDPLAHLAITTTAHGAAARLVDRLAHRYAGGRWLATGGGGYDVYRVVPRTWALTWLAGAHREVPAETPPAWRERWAADAARHGQAPPPATFDDPPDAGEVLDPLTQVRARAVAAEVRAGLVPRLVREATDRGWWDPRAADPARAAARRSAGDGAAPPDGVPSVRVVADRAAWDRLVLPARVMPPFEPWLAHDIVGRAVEAGASATAAVVGDRVVGLAVAADGELLAVGVAPAWRRRGLATALLGALADAGVRSLAVRWTVAERDVVDPLPVADRRAIARRLVARVGAGSGA
ncbi:MAG: GNAT family N-acetyltransferase [Candidatus Limnocylindria bacterium]